LSPFCRRDWRARVSEIAGITALIMVLASCRQAPQSVSEALTEACTDARERLASAPPPTDPDTEAAFRRAAEEATQVVGDVADGLADQGDDQTIADLAWQLHRFPSAGQEQSLANAHEARAAILRIDRFAHMLEIPDCGAATWRPADWRAIADRLADSQSNEEFRQDLNRLCEETFPEPSLLRDGVPLLTAMVANPGASAPTIDVREDPKDRLVRRLRPSSDRPGDTRRFLTAFSNELPELQPSSNLDDEYLALLAALLGLDAAIPRGMPREPLPAVRERVNEALDQLEDAWQALDITC